MADETLREKLARETAEGVGRKCWDVPLLRAFGIKFFSDTVSVELTPEQAQLAHVMDALYEVYEDEAQALRAEALERLRGGS